MSALSSRDAALVLDAVAKIGAATRLEELWSAIADAAYELIPSQRAGLVSIDAGGGTFSGTHAPTPVDHLMAMMPPAVRTVPLVAELHSTTGPSAMRISDRWTRREWHSQPIWSELYGPYECEHQLATRVVIQGEVMHSMSLFRPDRDFSDREKAMVAEFNRHARIAALRVLRTTPGPGVSGLTRRQVEVLRALEHGETMRVAAWRLGIAEKTLENHLQEIYRRLGVNNRIAALRRLGGTP